MTKTPVLECLAAADAAAAGAAPAKPSAEVFAMIASIVDQLFGPSAQIRSIRLAPREGESEDYLHPWALEGRRQIYASHRVR